MRMVKTEEMGMPARAALRDLIWRVEHMRALLLDDAATADDQTVCDLLDTSEARRAIGLEPEATKADVGFLPAGDCDGPASRLDTEES